MKDYKEIISKTAVHMKELQSGEGSGHDWWHTCRVWKMASRLAASEGADSFIVELAALLHDSADWKFNNGDLSAGPRFAVQWLDSLGVSKEISEHVASIIGDMSFKGAGVKTEMKTLEGQVVQDADRLDAIGAVGIARTFAYGGSKGREIYNPELKPTLHQTFEDYKNNKGSSLNHFYEKLLLLRDLMNTQTAKQLAEHRHIYMEAFVQEFLQEWDGLS